MTTNTQKWITGLISTAVLVTGGIQVDGQIDPFIDKGAVYEIAVKPDDAGQANKVEIAKDKPEVTLSRWNGEESITISRAGEFNAFSRDLFSKTGKLERKDGKESVLIEPLQTDDGVKIDITLNEKPSTNKFDFNITGWEDLDFFYQPELTPEEIADGIYRPEDVVGSYAVYHKTKANHIIGQTNYMTGKLYHIYRPKVIDSGGNEIWGELGYSNGVLSVTVDQSFLDTATYPVRIDPTFGTTTCGTTNIGSIALQSNDTSQQIGYTATSTESITPDEVSACLFLHAAGTQEVVDVRLAVFSRDSAGINSHNLEVSVEKLGETFSTTTKTWFTYTFASSVELIPRQYIFAALGNGENVSSTNQRINIAGDSSWTASTTQYSENRIFANSYNNMKGDVPWSETPNAVLSTIASMYVTYTATAGGGGGFNPYIRNPKGPKGAGVSRDPNR